MKEEALSLVWLLALGEGEIAADDFRGQGEVARLKGDVLSVVEEEIAADDFWGGWKEGVGLLEEVAGRSRWKKSLEKLHLFSRVEGEVLAANSTGSGLQELRERAIQKS